MAIFDTSYSLGVTYELDDGHIETTSLDFASASDFISISFANLMEKIEYVSRAYDTPIMPFIQGNDASLWIRVPNDRHLSNMLRFLLDSGHRNAHLRLLREGKSPKESPPITSSKVRTGTAANEFEPFSERCISSFSECDIIAIPSSTSESKGSAILTSWRNLLAYIKSELAKGVQVYDISVTAASSDGDLQLCAQLDSLIWQRYLLKDHDGYEEYLALHSMLLSNIIYRERNVKNLQEKKKDLWLRLKFYHHDLMVYSSDSTAESRLSNTHQPFFMSECYFSDEERQLLLSFPISTGLPLNDVFTELQNTKIGMGMSAAAAATAPAAVLCSSHDLAPIIEKVFDIRKGYEKEKAFVAALKAFNKRKS
jgi:hypothetical protein